MIQRSIAFTILATLSATTTASVQTCREVVDVLVITPAVGETPVGVNTTAFGVLKFGVVQEIEKLGAELQVQPSREAACPSVTEKSQVARPGPISVSRPRFP